MINRKEIIDFVQKSTDENREAPMLEQILSAFSKKDNPRGALEICIREGSIISKGNYYLTKKDADEYWKVRGNWGPIAKRFINKEAVAVSDEASPTTEEKTTDQPKRGRKPKNEIA
ncbi:MAG: hypothetical protein PHX80_03970 [Candidatus Nanoarchaeia archaeon]|nr:hypothetical protein [Candidatus Nanoarchaeia archaeon]